MYIEKHNNGTTFPIPRQICHNIFSDKKEGGCFITASREKGAEYAPLGQIPELNPILCPNPTPPQKPDSTISVCV